MHKALRTFLISSFLLPAFLSTVVPAYAATSAELLTSPWRFSAILGASERYKLIDSNILRGQNMLRLTYDLHGTCLFGGDASAIVFDQPVNQKWRWISLKNYAKNCYNGIQTSDIPLSHFSGLDTTQPIGTFHARMWNNRPFTIEIFSAIVYSSGSFGSIISPSPTMTTQPTTTPSRTPTRIPTITQIPTRTPTKIPSLTPVPVLSRTPTPSATPYPTLTPLPSSTPVPPPPAGGTPTITPQQIPGGSWSIQSVSSMKETKDRICNPRPADFVARWVDSAKTLGVNYVAIETPYQNPGCGDALAYTRVWVQAVRSRGLNVWHRHMPLAFEGIYDTPKNKNEDFLKVISDYIRSNPTLFAEGDIFSPIPEPQNGGISGITYCAAGICVFNGASHFNQWLRDAIDVSEQAFASIGLGGKIKIGYYGFDGFVAWGDNNPDWDGILEDATVIKMGNITIDHYPEAVGDTMSNDLDELEARYPNIPIIIGEWGTITPGDFTTQIQKTMQAAKRTSVVGFNYWHMGVGGNEQLVNESLTPQVQYTEVQKFFKL